MWATPRRWQQIVSVIDWRIYCGAPDLGGVELEYLHLVISDDKNSSDWSDKMLAALN